LKRDEDYAACCLSQTANSWRQRLLREKVCLIALPLLVDVIVAALTGNGSREQAYRSQGQLPLAQPTSHADFALTICTSIGMMTLAAAIGMGLFFS